MEAVALRGRDGVENGELSYRAGEVVLIIDASHKTRWVAEKIEDWRTEDGRGECCG
jgi:hypothetical protein